MVQYITKMIFAVLDVSLIMGLNIGESDQVFNIILTNKQFMVTILLSNCWTAWSNLQS